MIGFRLVTVLATFAVALSAGLKKYNVSDVTVSGLSAGAYMAVQMHVAYSSVVNGAAIFAGGPYYCAEGNIIYAEEKCMDTYMGKPMASKLASFTNNQEALGKIDKTSNLKDDKVYLFSGLHDSVVDPTVMQVLQEYYEYFVNIPNIVGDYSIDAEHCFPTLDQGNACTRLGSPYIGKCSFDGAGNVVQVLYGDDLKAGTAVNANLVQFDQTGYFTNTRASIGDKGYIYVPTACANGAQCHLHIALHGCQQTIDDIGDKFASETGYNRWAEANNVIVLYPFVKKSMSAPSNPNGCWDWWGYTDTTNYYAKSGVQMKFIRDLITAVSGL